MIDLFIVSFLLYLNFGLNQVFINKNEIDKNKNFRELWILNSPESLKFAKGLTLLKNYDELSCMIKASIGVFNECNSGWDGVIVNNPFSFPQTVIIIELNEAYSSSDSYPSSRFIIEDSKNLYNFINSFNSEHHNSLLITDDNSEILNNQKYILQNNENYSVNYNNITFSLNHFQGSVDSQRFTFDISPQDLNNIHLSEMIFNNFATLLNSMKIDKEALKLIYINLKITKAQYISDTMENIQREFIMNTIVPSLIGAYSKEVVIIGALKSKFSPKSLIEYQIKTATAGMCKFNGEKIVCSSEINGDIKNNLCKLFYNDYKTIFDQGDCHHQKRKHIYLVQRQQNSKNPHNLYTWAEFDDSYAQIFMMCFAAVIIVIFFIVGGILAITNIDPSVYSILYRETPTKMKLE